MRNPDDLNVSRQLLEVLEVLDRRGCHLAAVHIVMALEAVKIEMNGGTFSADKPELDGRPPQ